MGHHARARVAPGGSIYLINLTAEISLWRNWRSGRAPSRLGHVAISSGTEIFLMNPAAAIGRKARCRSRRQRDSWLLDPPLSKLGPFQALE
jgi:hypothetical protein